MLPCKPIPLVSQKLGVCGKPVSDEITDQRELLLKELEFFMETSELEQRRRLSEDLPTLDEYITCRMETSAVGVTSAFNE